MSHHGNPSAGICRDHMTGYELRAEPLQPASACHVVGDNCKLLGAGTPEHAVHVVPPSVGDRICSRVSYVPSLAPQSTVTVTATHACVA